ncbi:MAG: DUF6356 family protein [Alphaproteobacteria bacterium]|nr:DUF6356 family protein [Alphaproteobacteria bacterium]
MEQQKTKFPDKIPTDCPKRALHHILKSYTEHPAEAGESFWQHLQFTTTMSLRLVLTGIALFIHGIFPFLFCRTTSTQSVRIREIFDARSSLSEKEEQRGV